MCFMCSGGVGRNSPIIGEEDVVVHRAMVALYRYVRRVGVHVAGVRGSVHLLLLKT